MLFGFGYKERPLLKKDLINIKYRILLGITIQGEEREKNREKRSKKKEQRNL
jgi:hypothetical protein